MSLPKPRAALKAHLGLDVQQSWIVISETNDFIWPGPDIHPIPGRLPHQFDFGMLPPRFFAHVRDELLKAAAKAKLRRVQRTE